MKKLIAIFAAVLLPGCAQYTLEGRQYSGAEAFLEASKTLADEATNYIQPLPQTLTKKSLIFASPNANMFRQNFILLQQKSQKSEMLPPQLEILDNLIKNDQNMVSAFGKGIQRRNIYKSVSFATIDSPTGIPEPGKLVDVLYAMSADGKPSQWYYVSQKSGKQIFAYDRAVDGQKEVTRAFVEAVQAYALRD